MIVTPNFHFRGNCKDAIELYKEVFNIDILCMFKNKDANPSDYVSDNKYSGRVYHAEVMLGNTCLIISDISEEKEHIPGNSL